MVLVTPKWRFCDRNTVNNETENHNDDLSLQMGVMEGPKYLGSRRWLNCWSLLNMVSS